MPTNVLFAVLHHTPYAAKPELNNEVKARKRLSLHRKAQQNYKDFLVTFLQKSDMY